MAEYIMTGCDPHDKDNLLLIAEDARNPEQRSYPNTQAGRGKMIAELKRRQQESGAKKILFAYEASSLGFGLYEELTEAGIVCFVLAPTKLLRSPKRRLDKPDERDARDILGALRAHVLAGNELPDVWVPDPETRADRALVRMRLNLAEKLTVTKNQVQALLKLHGLKKPASVRNNWTEKFHQWLAELATSPQSPLVPRERLALASLIRQVRSAEEEIQELDRNVAEVATQPRYAEPARTLCGELGVGLLTAMVFLTERGDLSRFQNRRQIGAYLGLVPAKWESGQQDDRKGHLTHQGPARVRKVLNQAVWSRRAHPQQTREFFEDLEKRAPKRKKIHVVGHMRKLAILLWHLGLEAPRRAGSYVNT